MLTLTYAVDTYVFSERIVFPDAPYHFSPQKLKTLNQMFFLAHIAAGISYFKAFLPPEIKIESGILTQAQAQFFNRFYLSGLGEFAVRNNLNLQGKINFPFGDDAGLTVDDVYQIPASNKVFVPVGGGKDSCVTLELLRPYGFDMQVVSVGNPQAIRLCAEASAVPHRVIKRTLDAQLMALNASGKVLNGHIPITGVLAFYLWIDAVSSDTPFVALSCERSANVGNLYQGNLEINHQYSKSLDFERDFRSLTERITPDFYYFSALRPLSEIHIAKLFARLCGRYFDTFTSCNKAFKLDETARLTHWCGQCDKCRFVFLMLAPFMQPEVLIQAVGTNMLDDETQAVGYAELLGMSGHKPFECVGTPAECRWAFRALSHHPFWGNTKIVQEMMPRIPDQQSDEADLFCASDAHCIPAAFQRIMQDFG